ncbi:PREDICTED: alanine aminotransferase 2-like [Nanorana parkeri]|uniref:alanine aminotransferase 2-like n=1 Tax=Nanorana parkeri TaxID=125878 RepID=UPI000854EDFC|nr:PREDICTED: alanine aminotransferase 2-like [Nanorana parkeri]XP_018418136.1 PREDICTED: alanine aminotransferase 2-like [Nanorana parkeri]XP_018418137.1 PREDICTED: alanine aminotransferase 2-like [Nanorana parkeri]XP_018418138.1 PREDICTED: alanine aminotransferase 2-like [Nanorana parkeri]XP_018418139.1 PREDICTED: alanine aminotransferase 2-like [Nanorana parkeri]XP_018418140.1 PREDICTED: alanine aminotransferase 2-like [Nanorana parkeri]
MAPGKRLLNLETMNQAVLDVKVPILGSLWARAVEMQREINQGIVKPFGNITRCTFGDQQAMGHKPRTFLRQVAALCTYPDLLNTEHFAEDAKRRAREILKNLDNGSVGSYNPNYVSRVLPSKIATFLERRDGGVPANPRNIIVSGGMSKAILNVLLLVVNEEEPLRTGFVVPVPHYPLYGDAIALFGATKVEYVLDEERGWAVNVDRIRESLCAARKHCTPKVLCVLNPGNPTGHVLSRDNIEEIIRLAAEENLLLFADEVYQENVFAPGAVFHSLKKVLFEMGPEYSERVQLVSIYSISKGISGECGLRAGYIEFVNVDRAVFEYFAILKSYDIPSIIAVLAMEVLVDPPQPGDPSYETFQAEAQNLLSTQLEKARLAEEILNRAPGIHCNPIHGALYAFPRIQIPERAVSLAQERGQAPDVFFCHLLLEETGIVLVDGTSFGQAKGTYHFRISLLHPLEELKSILEKIVEFHGTFLQEYS